MSRPTWPCPRCGQKTDRDPVSLKTAKTIKEFRAEKCMGYGLVIVPVGSRVSNNTACGNDDSYRFWLDYHKVAEEVSGFKDSMLHHDMKYRGLNIPAEYCEPYPED